MSRIFIHGSGAASPAGWGCPALEQALPAGVPLPTQELVRPGHAKPLRLRRVPAPTSRPAFLAHPRLRRTSPITHYAVASAIEALGAEAVRAAAGGCRLGIIFCAFAGCVNYSRRFYDETLRDPATASPLVFPETASERRPPGISRPISEHGGGEPGRWSAMKVNIEEGARALRRRLVAGRPCGQLPRGRRGGGGYGYGGCAATGLARRHCHRGCGCPLFAARTPGRWNWWRSPSRNCLPGFRTVRKHCNAPGRNWRGSASSAGRRFSSAAAFGAGLGAASAWQTVAACAALAGQETAEVVVEILGSNEQAAVAVLRRS
jgi:hypothetical protein